MPILPLAVHISLMRSHVIAINAAGKEREQPGGQSFSGNFRLDPVGGSAVRLKSCMNCYPKGTFVGLTDQALGAPSVIVNPVIVTHC